MADNLPVEIAHDIFSRLLAETVLTCKLVCKTWHNYLSHDSASFAKIHLRQLNRPQPDHKNGAAGSKVRLGFISLSKSGHPLRYGEYYKNKRAIQFRKITHRLIRKGKCNTDLRVGSCNGLICLAESRSNLADPVHICNPINRECLQLPVFDENNDYESVNQVCSGFGYSTRTNEYKVVRILYYDDSDHGTIGHIQVYTLGSGNGWRNKGVITEMLNSTYGVFAYGDLYWLDSNEKKMIVFTLSDEEFKILPSRPFYDPSCDEFFFSQIMGKAIVWC
ncbi:F-box protein At3g07870-like [Papaver somniferum]|uniref:F-box protein At3g07870-like n=1 Tax=Papaver somniferum TaxID=3469 RepID=UPI000E6FF64B|nr:F-box protein At3g07870-like [Papaver somniferum]